MPTMVQLLEEVYSGQERMSRDEIHRRAVAADVSADDLSALDALPEGEYTLDEVLDAMDFAEADETALESTPGLTSDDGVPPDQLDDDALIRELASLHRTRHDTLLHGSSQALQHHSERTTDLELEYLRRHPARDVDAERLRSGARERTA